jgi:hypothetical protein
VRLRPQATRGTPLKWPLKRLKWCGGGRLKKKKKKEKKKKKRKKQETRDKLMLVTYGLLCK